MIDGRRPSESFIPIAPTRKGKRGKDNSVQEALALTHEQVERNSLINDLRTELVIWRGRNYDGVTATSRKLLLHWADEHRDNRILFAQREAAETAIYLAEVAGRQRYGTNRDWREALEEINVEHNAGLSRVALKMATGSGKTVVMAMLIAWHTLNKVAQPRDARFVRRFLVVAPGITIRDRLRVLQPNDVENYYDQRDIVPADLRAQLGKAQVLVVNYHQFLLRDSKEIKGVSATTRKLLLNGREDPFKETEDAMVSRVLRGWGVGSGKKQSEILVLNDEAHHCYQDKPIAIEGEHADGEDKERNADARVWFKGLQAVARKVGIKVAYDLSATPFYLKGSGHKEGFIFPWVVSDFGLMDAIESGIVKIPRTPVDDDAEHDRVTYLDLWDKVGKDLPKRNRKDLDVSTWTPPDELVGALRSLYASYERAFAHWERELAPAGHTPPVFIVVCPNTAVSKLVYDWIGGYDAGEVDQERWAPGQLSLFSNVIDGVPVPRPRTILVDSAQLESGEALKKDFKDAAAAEIETYKAELRLRNPGADLDQITDEELLREVMNTVGKRGRLGEQVRCVVSVAMLTEGWDANTVTHILGIRAFRSQLLCEQVVGRGLRRRSYDVNEDGLFEPEYANVYGVPFAFIPTDKPVGPVKPPRPSTLVRSVEGRAAQRITFPRLTGYRLEAPEQGELYLPEVLPVFTIGRQSVPTWTDAAPIVGEAERIADVAEAKRRKSVVFHLAKRLVETHYRTDEGDQRPWLFPELLRIADEWLERCVEVEDGFSLAHLLHYPQGQSQAADAIYKAVNRTRHNRVLLRPILHTFEPVGSTERVSFITRKATIPTDETRCEVSHVVLDGKDGNTWEQLVAEYAEHHRSVAAYAKNDHLGFEIPYLHEGKAHAYVPDFLLRLKQREDDVVRTLLVEVSGGQKRLAAPGLVDMKVEVARNTWCVAVNNHGGFGRWGYLEITDMLTAKADLDAAIHGLYDDGPVIGHTDRSDLSSRRSRAAS
ncbi:MAG TPA: DEAD/DEAH box helicase family protein [Nocardioides sp.]|nr:DEAD/DEAH box helicase family protein [Nocardioides sp.]